MIYRRLNRKQGFGFFWSGKGKGFERQCEEATLVLTIIFLCSLEAVCSRMCLDAYQGHSTASCFLCHKMAIMAHDGPAYSLHEGTLEHLSPNYRDPSPVYSGRKGLLKGDCKGSTPCWPKPQAAGQSYSDASIPSNPQPSPEQGCISHFAFWWNRHRDKMTQRFPDTK